MKGPGFKLQHGGGGIKCKFYVYVFYHKKKRKCLCWILVGKVCNQQNSGRGTQLATLPGNRAETLESGKAATWRQQCRGLCPVTINPMPWPFTTSDYQFLMWSQRGKKISRAEAGECLSNPRGPGSQAVAPTHPKPSHIMAIRLQTAGCRRGGESWRR